MHYKQKWPRNLAWLTLRGPMNLRDSSDMANASPLEAKISSQLIPMLFKNWWRPDEDIYIKLSIYAKNDFSFRFVYSSKLTSLNLYTSITRDIHTKPKTLKKITYKTKDF